MRFLRLAWQNLITHLAAWIPMLVLIWDYYHKNLTVNPIQDAEQRTGKTALVLLVLSLSVTPVNTITGWRPVIHLRRPLGVYAFLYALAHFTIFTWLDYGLNLEFLREAVLEKPYALVGLAALLLLIPLAATSWRWWMKRLGKGWKKLHQLVYPAGVLVIIHYGWVKKGDFFQLRGDILQPVLFGVLLVILLALRLTYIRRRVAQMRIAMTSRLRERRQILPKQTGPNNP